MYALKVTIGYHENHWAESFDTKRTGFKYAVRAESLSMAKEYFNILRHKYGSIIKRRHNIQKIKMGGRKENA